MIQHKGPSLNSHTYFNSVGHCWGDGNGINPFKGRGYSLWFSGIINGDGAVFLAFGHGPMSKREECWRKLC